jgi:CubicO group peptidase (beta-lactamase class C family)
MVVAIAVAGCSGQSTAPSASQLYASTESAYLQALGRANRFSGEVLVAVSGRVVLRSSVGYADWHSKTPNQSDTRFRLGSITKLITAMAVMLLVEDGRLQLDDPACNYVTNCTAGWRTVTVRNLLTHTSGIPDYLPPVTLAQFNAPTPPLDLISLVADKPLDFPPGSQVEYSNTNYVLLGLIIESVSGLPYATFLEQRIFRPLGMSASGYQRDFSQIAKAATGYGYKTQSTLETIPTDEAAFSDGGLYSTVDDLFKFDQELSGHRLLSPAIEDQMFTPWGGEPAGFPLESDIGLGWFLKQGTVYGVVAFHGGRIPGYSGAFERHLGSHVTAVVLSNFYWADSSQIASTLADAAPTPCRTSCSNPATKQP